MSTVITAECLIRVFATCLSWQWRPEYVGMWTTFDKVKRILGQRGLGKLNDHNLLQIQQSRYFRSLLKPHFTILPGGLHLCHDVTNQILSARSTFVVFTPVNKRAVPWDRVAHDHRVFLTQLGLDRAAKWQIEMVERLGFDKATYLGENERQNERFDGVSNSKAFIISQYQKRVQREAEESR